MHPRIQIGQKIIENACLFLLEVVADLRQPFDGVTVDAEIVEIVIWEVIFAVTAANWLGGVIVRLLVLLVARNSLLFVVFFGFLWLKFLLCDATIRSIDGTVIEKFAIWNEIGRIQIRPKATTDSMDVNPLVIITIEPFLISQLTVPFAKLLKLWIFLLKMISFLASCLDDWWVCEHFQLCLFPKGDDVYFFGEVAGHEGPDAVSVYWEQIEQVCDEDPVLPKRPLVVKSITKDIAKFSITQGSMRCEDKIDLDAY